MLRLPDFYNGNKLLSMKDINGKTPEIFMCEGNRTAGKTYFFKRLCLRRWQRGKGKFAIYCRHTYELDGAHEAFFKDLEEVDFQGHIMDAEWAIKGMCKSLMFDGEECGYAIGMWNRDVIKQKSSMFVDVGCMFMDEFQSEAGKYIKDELGAFMSIHTSVARGGGKHTRYVPVFMASNGVSTINPYFTGLGIGKRLKDDCKFMRGDGWVLERTFNKEAAQQISESAFARAFSSSKQMQYAAGSTYLLDNDNFIACMRGEKRPMCNLIHNGNTYGIWQLEGKDVYVVSEKHDPGYPVTITCQLSSHTPASMLVKQRTYSSGLLNAFNRGCVFFENAYCKDAFLDVIGFTQSQKQN